MVDREFTPTRISAEEYFQLPEYEEHTLIQLIDGEVIISMAPILKHQDIVREIIVLFAILSRQKGGKAYPAPTEVYLDKHNIYEPDVLYLKPDTQCVMDEKRLIGAPDLVVEVLSPGTAKYDRDAKFQAYQKHEVNEYWIIDPAHDLIEVWTLNESGKFAKLGVFDKSDTFQSITLDEKITVKTIFPA